MIADLLAYSKLAHEDRIGFGPVNLEQVLPWVEQNLREIIQEKQATVTHGSLPKVEDDFGRLAQLFQNVVENAIKYRRDEPPRIHISARQQGDEWVLCVSDNGLGFDPKYAGRVFGIFKRLHGAEYAGTGIGLAICKKIVERHGGRMWAESAPGKGSRFYFTLPVATVSAAAAARP